MNALFETDDIHLSLLVNQSPGIYAVNVTGALPESIQHDMVNNGIQYRCRDARIRDQMQEAHRKIAAKKKSRRKAARRSMKAEAASSGSEENFYLEKPPVERKHNPEESFDSGVGAAGSKEDESESDENAEDNEDGVSRVETSSSNED